MIDSTDFRRVLGHFPTGVTVVTSSDDDGPIGVAIGSFASVSLDPPLVLFSVGASSDTWTRIKPTGRFAVNILGDDQAPLCGVFASKVDNKFKGVETHEEVTGAPIIEGSVAWIDCEIHAMYDGGDHEIVVGLVKALDVAGDQAPLLFFQGKYGRFEAI